MEHVVNKIPISFTEVSSSVMVLNSIRVNTSKCVMCREVILGSIRNLKSLLRPVSL